MPGDQSWQPRMWGTLTRSHWKCSKARRTRFGSLLPCPPTRAERYQASNVPDTQCQDSLAKRQILHPVSSHVSTASSTGTPSSHQAPLVAPPRPFPAGHPGPLLKVAKSRLGDTACRHGSGNPGPLAASILLTGHSDNISCFEQHQ